MKEAAPVADGNPLSFRIDEIAPLAHRVKLIAEANKITISRLR